MSMPDEERPPAEPTGRAYGPPRTIHALRSGVHIAARQLLAITGLGMIALAIPIGMATPFIPIGLPMAVIGVVLLGRNAVWGRRWMESVLRRHPRLERMAPSWLMRSVFGREKKREAD